MNDEILEKREEASALYDVYKGVLTPIQSAVFSDYYLYDLSLSEIAESRSISRAAVNDSLKKGLAKMREVEKEVALLKKKRDLQSLSFAIDQAANAEEKDKAVKALQEYIHHGL
jgi:predicted DNA-binding protein YlxM (UPF0122 family)